jgi:hypothetical protein
VTLEPDYSLEEVAEALGMSTRWVRDRIKEHGLHHIRRGRQIFFTADQADVLRTLHVVAPVPQSVTTGKKRKVS